MKLEIKYPDKSAHEVELAVKLAVLGRDPSCDLVINDERCSRRHAVIEETPTGLQVRDAGSANGVFVNGKKTERSSLVAGDLVRLGEVILKVLPGDPPSTVVMAPDDLVDLGTSAAERRAAGPTALGTEPRPVAASQPKRAAAPPSSKQASSPVPGTEERRARARASRVTGPPDRPSTITTLAALWGASIFLYGASAVLSPFLGIRDRAGTAHFVVSALLALVSAGMAWGLFTRKPWARLAQAGIAGIGLLVCPFTLASATTLIYVLRPATREAFEGKAGTDDPGEMTFTLTLIGTVLLGVLLLAGAILATRFVP